MKSHTNKSDLDQLVAMAEDVSSTVNDVKTRITNLRVMALLSGIGVYATIGLGYYLYKINFDFRFLSVAEFTPLIGIAVIFSIGCLFFLVQYIIKIGRYRKELETESAILHRLLDMVYEHQELVSKDESSFVEAAVLEMKLQRIKFSSKW